MPNNLIESYASFKKAYEKLKEFVETDNDSEKDRGAIINAFQYTFELFWKTLQKYMRQMEMLDELEPSSTIRTAFQYNLLEEGQGYMNMLKDRNLITHTYKEDTAMDIYQNIKKEYIGLLNEFIEKFDTKIL